MLFRFFILGKFFRSFIYGLYILKVEIIGEYTMYALQPKKPRYLINNILDELYEFASDLWNEEYLEVKEVSSAHICHGAYGSPAEYDDNSDKMHNDITYLLNDKWGNDFKEGFESEIRGCISNLAEEDAGRIMKWMGLTKDWSEYPTDNLQDEDGFIEAIINKFIERRL